jgi:hypothetical protein
MNFQSRKWIECLDSFEPNMQQLDKI